MRRVRRTFDEPRLEVMPLVDVIFLLLTFFVFAMTLMVRAQVLDVSLPRIGAGRPADAGRLITISIDRDGGMFLDGEPIDEAEIGAAVAERIDSADQPARVVIAADESGATGRLLRALDALAAAGVENVSVMGTPRETTTLSQEP